MNFYKLSKDYERLFDLIAAGNVVVGFVLYKDFDVRDVVQIIRRKSWDVFIGARGIQYGGLYEYMSELGTEKQVFVHRCKGIGLEWIDPE